MNKIKILATRQITHNVKSFILEKPKGFELKPGMAADWSLNQKEWEKEIRPFTFTATPEEKILELTVKGYPERKGVTKRLHELKPGDEIMMHGTFQTYEYKGPGVFIAGGAGITPFLAILRDLYKKDKLGGNTLIFSNKRQEDIIDEHELKTILGDNCIFTLSEEKREGYEYGRIDEKFLKSKIKSFNQPFYICGPPKFTDAVKEILEKQGAPILMIAFE